MSLPNRIRTHGFSMRLREYDDALLDAKKDEAEMTKSDYLRNVILFAAAGERPRFSSPFAEEIREGINLVGNSVNEIAHGVNSRRGTRPADFENLMENFLKLMTVYDKFVRDKVNVPY